MNMSANFSKILLLSGLALGLIWGSETQAHLPVIEGVQREYVSDGTLILSMAHDIKDPTEFSQAIYGRLSEPKEVDLYTFLAKQDAEIPIEVFVPVRPSNTEFRPTFVFIEQGGDKTKTVPFKLRKGWQGLRFEAPKGERGIFYEEYSLENLYKNTEAKVTVKKDQRYYIAIFEPKYRIGDYSLAVGTAENFDNAQTSDLIKNVLTFKLNLAGTHRIPWNDVIGLFLMLSGFIIGLGAATVVDWLGILGMKSEYWTEAATRTHRVTRILIWVGLSLSVAGGFVYYNATGLSGTASLHAVLAAILLVNGVFLNLSVSPYLRQRELDGKGGELLSRRWKIKIGISLIVSFIGWWGGLFLLVWNILMLR